MGGWITRNGNHVYIKDAKVSLNWFKDLENDDVIPVDPKYYDKFREPHAQKDKEIKKIRSPKKEKVSFVKTIIKKSALGICASILSIVTVSPIPLLVYKAYLAKNMSFIIMKKLEEKGIDKQLVLIKEGLKDGIQNMLNFEIKKIVEDISNVFDSSGFVMTLSQDTLLEPHFIKNALENTMSSVLENGIDDFIVPVVDAL